MNDQKIIVVTDSSASLPEEIKSGLDLRVIPLWLVWDNESFRDGVDIQSDFEFFIECFGRE